MAKPLRPQEGKVHEIHNFRFPWPIHVKTKLIVIDSASLSKEAEKCSKIYYWSTTDDDDRWNCHCGSVDFESCMNYIAVCFKNTHTRTKYFAYYLDSETAFVHGICSKHRLHWNSYFPFDKFVSSMF